MSRLMAVTSGNPAGSSLGFAAVLVDAGGPASRRAFDYIVPNHLMGLVRPGSLVTVPFGRRYLRGLVVSLLSSSSVTELKPIRELYPSAHLADRHAPQLAEMLSSRYACSLIEAYRAILPLSVAGQTARVWRVGDQPAPEPGRLDPGLEAIYGLALEKGGISLERVVQALDFERREALTGLRRLTDQGWLEQDPVFEEPPSQHASSVFAADEVAATEELPRLERRAPVQAAVLRALLAAGSPLPEEQLQLSVRPASRREALRALEKRGLIARSGIHRSAVGGGPVPGLLAPRMPLKPDLHQALALAEIVPAVRAPAHRQFLLFGVTGSGKTEVYLQAIAAALESGRQALVLVPEIGLTPQAVTRFEARFPGRVSVIHSRLAAGERARAWRDLAAGRSAIALGPRSAAFAPLPNLGLVVVDEEHDPSYKQGEIPRYDAREVSRYRASLAGVPVIFGTATPSVEMFWAATAAATSPGPGDDDGAARVELLELPQRIDGKLLPEIQIVDMRGELAANHRSIFSRPLQSALAGRLARSEQVILFLNRRGLATFVLCRDCGYIARCRRCEVSLVYHLQDTALRCHYCGHREAVPTVCPVCRSRRIRHFGAGTERVEAEVRALFPASRVARLDLDVAVRRNAVRDVLGEFARGSIDVLVGTQMIAKGLDVPNVTLVGVVAADTALAFPDFRAGERTFSMVTQVAGRAGRGTVPGLVVVQTYSPDHYSLVYARNHDYRGFFEAETELRRELRYPPFAALGLVRLSGPAEDSVADGAYLVARELEAMAAGVEVLGPAPAPLPRLQGRYRWNIVLKGKDSAHLASLATRAMDKLQGLIPAGVRLGVDLEPQEML